MDDPRENDEHLLRYQSEAVTTDAPPYAKLPPQSQPAAAPSAPPYGAQPAGTSSYVAPSYGAPPGPYGAPPVYAPPPPYGAPQYGPSSYGMPQNGAAAIGYAQVPGAFERSKITYDRRTATYGRLDPMAIMALSQLCGADMPAVQWAIDTFIERCNSALEPLRVKRRRYQCARVTAFLIAMVTLITPIAYVQTHTRAANATAYYVVGPMLAMALLIVVSVWLRRTAPREMDFEPVLRATAAACMAESPALARHGVVVMVELQQQDFAYVTATRGGDGRRTTSAGVLQLTTPIIAVAWQSRGLVPVVVTQR